jgi:hypothetical protein
MRLTTTILSLNGLLLVAGAAVLIRQHQENSELHLQLEALRSRAREIVQLREENRRMASARTASVTWEALRAERGALGRLRAELAGLNLRSDERLRATIPAAATTDPTPPTQVGRTLVAAEWKNSGRATPSAALESSLWAATSGEVDRLAETLVLESGAWDRAKALLLGLPDADRARYGSPERLIALFTAEDLSVNALQVLKQTEISDQHAKLAVKLNYSGGEASDAQLSAMKFGDGWRLLVPEAAAEKYLAKLKAAAAPAAKQ